MSLISKRILSDTYDLLDVMGPDEYHEHVKTTPTPTKWRG